MADQECWVAKCIIEIIPSMLLHSSVRRTELCERHLGIHLDHCITYGIWYSAAHANVKDESAGAMEKLFVSLS